MDIEKVNDVIELNNYYASGLVDDESYKETLCKYLGLQVLKKSSWMHSTEYRGHPIYSHYPFCSNCGYSNEHETNFCPQCGSSMFD